MSMEEEKGLLARADEFLQAFKKGAEFTQSCSGKMSVSGFGLSNWRPDRRARG